MSQRMDALALANERRAEQVQLRRLIGTFPQAGGRQAVASILRQPTPEQARVKADYLLGSIYRFGPAYRGKLVRKVGLPAGRFERPLAELSKDERHLIADYLENPNLPARSPDFTAEELALVEQVCSRLAPKVNGRGDLLRSIALKASLNLASRGQQADGQGAPVPHPDRSPVANGQPGIAADATRISSPASAADLEGGGGFEAKLAHVLTGPP